MSRVTVERVRTDVPGPALKDSYRFDVAEEGLVPRVEVRYARFHWRPAAREPDADDRAGWSRDFLTNIDVEEVPADVLCEAAEAYQARAGLLWDQVRGAVDE
jgi:hypothetical protein